MGESEASEWVLSIIKRMVRKLKGDIADMGRLHDGPPPEMIQQFREIRYRHNEIQGLLFSIQDRLKDADALLPTDFTQWLVRQKLNELSYFIDISHGFISNPPITLTHSLGSFDLLTAEKASLKEVLGDFDTMLSEAGIEGDELHTTRSKIEDMIATIEELLKQAPKPLPEFR